MSGNGNIGDDLENDDPDFVDADGEDNQPGTEDDNVRLSLGSGCVDKGDNSVVTETFDRDGNPRVVNCIVDMGAYEHQRPCTGLDEDGDGVCDSCDVCPGYDDASPCTIPTISEWGLVAMTLLVLTAATLVLTKRRAASAA